MRIQRFEVPGRLPGLNEYTKACRSNPRAGARMKREAEEAVMWAAKAAGIVPARWPVTLRITWVEANTRRDKDNVRFAAKFVQDALVSLGILPNDGWRQIGGVPEEGEDVGGITDRYMVNAASPRVIVEIEESV